jgi:hypothetical protein
MGERVENKVESNRYGTELKLIQHKDSWCPWMENSNKTRYLIQQSFYKIKKN